MSAPTDPPTSESAPEDAGAEGNHRNNEENDANNNGGEKPAVAAPTPPQTETSASEQPPESTPGAAPHETGESAAIATEETAATARTQTQSSEADTPRGGWVAPIGAAEEERRAAQTTLNARDAAEVMRNGGTIKGKDVQQLTLKRSTYSKPIEFRDCDFRRLQLEKVTFEESVIFKHCTFDSLFFNGATFNSYVLFDACEFRGEASLMRFRVSGKFALRCSTVRGKLVVSDATFDGLVDAWDSTFEQWSDFRRVTFSGDADFRSLDCLSGLVFSRCTFKGDALFRGASVEKKFALVHNTTVEGCLDLQKARLHSFSYLDEVHFGPDACFCVWNTTPQAMLIRPEQIKGRISPLKRRSDQPRKGPLSVVRPLPQGASRGTFDGVEYEFDHAQAAEEYGVLKNNYQRLNWLDDEDWAYYHFKVHKRRSGAGRSGLRGKSARALEWLIFDVGCAYGTSPMRVLRSAAYVILFFAIFYAAVLFSMPADAAEILQRQADGSPALVQYTIFGVDTLDKVASALLHSTSAFVFGFNSIERNVDGWPALLLIVQGLFGMLLFGLFIVAFSRKVIR